MKKQILEAEQSATVRRRIKVGQIHQHRFGGKLVAVPFVRFSGKWLDRMGFGIGKVLELNVREGEILLTTYKER